MNEPGQTERRRIIYAGRVQGVGFRYTTASIARRFPVTGFVRNLRDGTVELVAEGEPAVLEKFLGEIETTFERNIKDCSPQEVGSRETFTRFEVRR